jgi:alpha-L-arabinofuranosidase
MKKTKELEMVRVPIYTPEQLVEKIKKGEKIGMKVDGKQTH